MAPGLSSPHARSDETISTLPDPRSPLTSPELSRSNSVSHIHPELNSEVAALSNKLIHAINHQTDLDDTLTATRHELEAAQVRVRQLEPLVQEHKSLVTNGILVKQSDVENELLRLRTTLADERRQRVKVENEKKGIEQELENLTAALFEEANEVGHSPFDSTIGSDGNQMVAAARKDARKDREPLERRNEQLQAKLNDAELLLASHQEQLAELKTAMQDMSTHRNEIEKIDTDTNVSTAPSTPAPDGQDNLSRVFDALNLSPTTPGTNEIPPAPPTTFSHLLRPVLRTDVQAYEDFRVLLVNARKSQPSSRVTSGNFSGLGLGNLTPREQSQGPERMASTGSTSSLSASKVFPQSPSTPNLPTSTSSSFSSREPPVNGAPLKDTAFYKRVLTEDIEPTLRLDTAPGLSWLARRTVISSMSEGKLIVEPTPPAARLYYPPCALCGEQARDETHARTHRFRTSDSESAQRYPLCQYCLGRVRASCDFLGFLRMIKDGYWRTDGAQGEALAWEESVRLRERMFWSRIGGGVVPAFLRARESDTPRSSVEEEKTTSTLAGSQTSLASQDLKPERPSPLSQETKAEVDQSTAQDTKLVAPSPTPLENTSEQTSTLPSVEDMTPRMPSQIDIRDHSPSRSPNQPHPRGLSRTETNGRGTVARRAAMFERTTSDDAASKQLQTELQSSLKGRSPIKGRSPSPAVHASDPDRSASGTVPGSYNF
ncbi:rab guanine nucleotide exchange factor S2 [Puttea exsequens]|nr:rab guanine nucleotide exchange factor S2 [Puttea exsequens]